MLSWCHLLWGSGEAIGWDVTFSVQMWLCRWSQGGWKSGLGCLEVRGAIMEVRLYLLKHVYHGFSVNIQKWSSQTLSGAQVSS